MYRPPASEPSPLSAALQLDDTLPKRVEVCGMGVIELGNAKQFAERFKVTLDELRTTWRESIANHPNYDVRALDLYLKTGTVDLNFRLSEAAAKAVDGSRVTRSNDAIAALEELINLATTSNDRVAYAFASYACDVARRTDSPSSCSAVTDKHWAQIDADNAVPWLRLARSEHYNKRFDAEGEAVSRAATASRYENYDSTYTDIVQRTLLLPANSLPRMLLTEDLLSQRLLWSQPADEGALLACNKKAILVDDRRETCMSLAKMLLKLSVNHGTFYVGRRVAEMAGFPQERIAELKKQDAIYTRAQFAKFTLFSDPSCTGIKKWRDYYARTAEVGELQASLELYESMPHD